MEGATLGFSPADWLELQRLQGRLDKIRFGPRILSRPPIHISGLPDLGKPKRPASKERRKPPADPGYERYQLRLW